jgi:heat shock protein HslJ
MNRSLLTLLWLLAGLLAVACNSDEEDSGGQKITGRVWRLDSLIVHQEQLSVPKSSEAFLRFDGNGAVSGNTGCNSLGGEAVVRDDGTISFGPLMQTEIACDEPRMTLEAKFTGLLGVATRWHLANGVLRLHTADGRSSATFR